MPLSLCGICPLGRLAARHPQSLLARIWRWHTGWCPSYKAFQHRQAAPAPNPPAGPGTPTP